MTCAAASTRSARAARQELLKPSTSSRWITEVYAASMLAGDARAGDRFRIEKKLMGTFTVGSSFQSPSSSKALAATIAPRARVEPRSGRASGAGVAGRAPRRDVAEAETRARWECERCPARSARARGAANDARGARTAAALEASAIAIAS